MNDRRMSGTRLTFYVPENRRLHGVLAYEWLLGQALKLGLHGGSAFRAAAGFGRRHHLHEASFFELAGDLPMAVTFVVDTDEEARLWTVLEHERVSLFYTREPVEYGVLNGDGGLAPQPRS